MEAVIDYLKTLDRNNCKTFEEDLKHPDYCVLDNCLHLHLGEYDYLRTSDHNLGIEKGSVGVEISGDFGGIELSYKEKRNTVYRLVQALELIGGVKLENKEEYKTIFIKA